MANCVKCNKETCSCSLREGLCKDCRKAAQEPQEKINVTVKLPKPTN